MRYFKLGALAALSVMQCAPPASADTIAEQQAAILVYYPAAAKAAGVSGTVVLNCTHDVQNTLRGCTLVSETPARQGFGDAALTIAAHAVPNPWARLTAAEQSAPTSVSFSFQAKGPAIYPNMLRPQPTQTVFNYSWRTAPTAEQWKAAYPQGAQALRQDGNVFMQCMVDEAGDVQACQVLQVSPKGVGFEEAAQGLLPDLKVWLPATGHSPGGSLIMINLPFKAPEDPRFLPPPATPSKADLDAAKRAIGYYPQSARAAGVQGEATLNCGQDAQQRLVNCLMAYERPAGYKFGDAALTLATMTPPNTTAPPLAPAADKIYQTYRFCLRPTARIDPDPLLPRHVIVNAKLDREPTDAEKAAVYPPAAQKAGASGRVFMHCRLGADGSLNDCIVSNETPEGQGFAAAARSLAGDYHAAPKTVDGTPQPEPGKPFFIDVEFGQKPLLPAPPVVASVDYLCGAS